MQAMIPPAIVPKTKFIIPDMPGGIRLPASLLAAQAGGNGAKPPSTQS